jgi:hypothetical protein
MPAAKSISRRHFLRSAGGVTFLALVPAERGLFAAPAAEGGVRLPLFTVLPYIQPGANNYYRILFRMSKAYRHYFYIYIPLTFTLSFTFIHF